MTLSGKRLLVTGAGGFIGSHLTERLVELGGDVRAFVEYNSLGSWGWLDDSPHRAEVDAVERLAIETEGLTKRYGSFVAVDGLSLAVREGEVFGANRLPLRFKGGNKLELFGIEEHCNRPPLPPPNPTALR